MLADAANAATARSVALRCVSAMLSVLSFDLRIFRLGVSDAGHCLLCAAARWSAFPYARRRGALN